MIDLTFLLDKPANILLLNTFCITLLDSFDGIAHLLNNKCAILSNQDGKNFAVTQ